MKKETVLDMFNELKKYIGEKIYYEYWEYGIRFTKTEVLEKVNYYRNIRTSSQQIPFIGYGCAIKKITLADSGKVLYYNPCIEDHYDRREENSIEKARITFYEPEVVFKMRSRRINKEEENNRIKELENKKSMLKSAHLKKEGFLYVKEDLKESWSTFVDNNTKDFNRFAILELIVKCMKALSNDADKSTIDQIIIDEEASYISSFILKILCEYTDLLKKEENLTLSLK